MTPRLVGHVATDGPLSMLTEFYCLTYLIIAAGQLTTARADVGDLEGAYQQAQPTLRRRPDNAHAHFTLAYVLRYAGLLTEATQECDVALSLDPGNYQLRSCAIPFILLGKTERARTLANLDVGSDWGNYINATLLMREGKPAEAREAVQRLSDNPFYTRTFLEAFLQRSSSSEFDRLSQEMESTLSGIPDPEPRYYRGALLVFCNQPQIGWRMIEGAIGKNYCVFEALESDVLLAKSRKTPEFRRSLSEAKVCQDRFLSERKQN